MCRWGWRCPARPATRRWPLTVWPQIRFTMRGLCSLIFRADQTPTNSPSTPLTRVFSTRPPLKSSKWRITITAADNFRTIRPRPATLSAPACPTSIFLTIRARPVAAPRPNIARWMQSAHRPDRPTRSTMRVCSTTRSVESMIGSACLNTKCAGPKAANGSITRASFPTPVTTSICAKPVARHRRFISTKSPAIRR